MNGLFAGMLAVGLACTGMAGVVARTNDWAGVRAEAARDDKLLLVSLGRDACSNCRKFYGYLEDESLALDTNRVIYVKLDVDNVVDQNAFFSHFSVMGDVLPFVGVANGKGKSFGVRHGFGTPDEYAELLRTAQDAANAWADEEQKRIEDERAAAEARAARAKTRAKK